MFLTVAAQRRFLLASLFHLDRAKIHGIAAGEMTPRSFAPVRVTKNIKVEVDALVTHTRESESPEIDF